MNRRTFLKIAGIGSLSFAAGCTSQPDKTLHSQVNAPEDMVIGKATWYATTCRECPAGCGVLAKNREGKIIKLEGNPYHPINQGKLCPRGQAALQGLYNPDRIQTPLLKNGNEFIPVSFSQALSLLKNRISGAVKKGDGKIRMVSEMTGKTLETLFNQSLHEWRSPPFLIFEPFAYESLKFANMKVFGIEGLPSYHMEHVDFLLSFGADFLETWLSPVEYALQFSRMRRGESGSKGLFYHIAPYQGLTGASADRFIFCRPGGEIFIALRLIGDLIDAGKGKQLPQEFIQAIKNAASIHTNNALLEFSGIPEETYQEIRRDLLNSKAPLILGTSTAALDINSAATDTAVNCMNLILDPALTCVDFQGRHAVERASKRSTFFDLFKDLESKNAEVLLLNNVNPVFSLPQGSSLAEVMKQESIFVVSFSMFMDETASQADLVFPILHPLERWEDYDGHFGNVSLLQPVAGKTSEGKNIGDILLQVSFNKASSSQTVKQFMIERLVKQGICENEKGWIEGLKKGGWFVSSPKSKSGFDVFNLRRFSEDFTRLLDSIVNPLSSGIEFSTIPSIRFFDGRDANKPWLCEMPDPMTQIAWQTAVLLSPWTAKTAGITQGEVIEVKSEWGRIQAPAFLTESVVTGLLIMPIGQGHTEYGRYAQGMGINPIQLLSPYPPSFSAGDSQQRLSVKIKKTGNFIKLANTDGSRIQHDRKIALSIPQSRLFSRDEKKQHGLGMKEFPLTLPISEGYDSRRDLYSPHGHDRHRWGMVIDLDRCIGCGACVVACYAENNIPVNGEERIVEGRELSWLRIERYHDPGNWRKIVFLPMLCQHCDNAPCEPVCPVYAPHHSKEGLNNQVYNRCIGTRFCSQNCPYKVRRFNWFEGEWTPPLHLQLNPEVTVRGKGVMEKCSFCVQRIKSAHGRAKDEGRSLRDGEVVPACVQTCPTGAFVFGNLMDPASQVRKLVTDPRAYQVMGYLNTKPAVIYLKKVIRGE